MYEVESQSTPALGERYNLLKSTTHLSVWMNMVLQSINDKKMKIEAHVGDLKKIKIHLIYLISLVQMVEEFHLLEKMILIVNQIIVIEDLGEIKSQSVTYLKEMGPINNKFSAQVVALQLNGMHQIVNYWLKDKPIDLDKTRILIVSPKGPREGLIEKQYFLDLFAKEGLHDAEKGSGHILNVEMLPEHISTVSTSSLIEFLQKHEINIGIGKTMLNNPQAMNKDILAPFAPEVLSRLCPVSRISKL